MMHIVVFIFTFLALLFLSILTITKPLFNLYAEHILDGHYVGETYAAYYFDFILYLVTPLCFIFSIFFVTYIYRRKKKQVDL
ncbi:hypothetical protein AOX56_22065 [Aeromonas sobria]|uniref:Uncharacterized protein n=1 Tax=Aeromonas sobria TaxID=646 RepID=A0A2N3IN57_AERSO|nr:hypothetical protein AOX56_22065 [Aeromonas sobria]